MNFTQAIRETELAQVAALMPPGCRILEVGAGAGWQARALQQRGFAVSAVDVAQSNYRSVQIYPVETYDGNLLPFMDRQFDVVFSSNVLEHIPHVEAALQEHARVLSRAGVAVHVVPSATWRLWSSLGHYPAGAREVLRLVWRRLACRKSSSDVSQATIDHPQNSSRPLWQRLLFAERHGEHGTALTELYSFSRRRWVSLFESTGWTVTRQSTNGLFYTGHNLMGAWLPIPARRLLSKLLGSSCHVFELSRKS